MKITKAFTGTTAGVPKRFIAFEFDAGCRMTRFAGGREVFLQKGNRVCREGAKQIQQMRDAVANRQVG